MCIQTTMLGALKLTPKSSLEILLPFICKSCYLESRFLLYNVNSSYLVANVSLSSYHYLHEF